MDPSQSYNERALFLSISEGDEGAFTTCYSEYGRMMMPFLTRLVGSRDSAEEIVQEVFLKVWLHRDRLAEVENPKGWLFRVAANAGRNWLKKKMIIESHLLAHRQQSELPHQFIPERLDLKTVTMLVNQTIQSFPPQRRKIYQMSREEGLKPAEIAARLDLSVSTVKNTLLSALKAIREKIEGAGFWGTIFLLFFKR
jgi:RNA polymerase sigma-70 factor (ECF subfamily)